MRNRVSVLALAAAGILAMNSNHDGYPVCDIDDAIEVLEDEIGGGDEDRGRDTRISGVIRLLRHLKARDALP